MEGAAAAAFVSSVRKQFDRNPVWVPGTEMRLGDIGLVRDGCWQLQTTLADLDKPIAFKVRKDSTKTKSIEVDSGDGVETSLRASASSTVPPLQGVAEGNAGLGLSFSGTGQFSIRVYGVVVNVLSNLASIEREMLDRFSGPDGIGQSWKADWAVVSEVMIADRGLVTVASKAGAECVLDLGVKLGTEHVSLGDASVDASIVHQAHMAAAYQFAEPTVVMYRARRLKTGLFTSPKVVDAIRSLNAIAGLIWGNSRGAHDVLDDGRGAGTTSWSTSYLGRCVRRTDSP